MFNWLAAWLGSTRDSRLAALNPPVAPDSHKNVHTFMTPEAYVIINPKPPVTSRFEQSPDFRSNGDVARKIDLMVLHCTEGSFLSAVAWLTAKDDTLVSAHYTVSKAGHVVQTVGINDVAYHAGGTKEKPSSWRGRGNINGRSIGVEIENKNDGLDPYTPMQLSVCLWLALRTCRQNNMTAEQVVGHEDVDPGRKTDPRNFPWPLFRTSLAVHLSRPGGIA
ncbi:MAG: N-acetylmuramoyl-L-alanine amidase [Sphingomonadaceae bacterium]|nr:N-acetylmuramoyl-L-alanine amidase [Sphingomonadaceae bacterium]